MATAVACDAPQPPPREEVYLEPESIVVQDVAPRVCPHCEPDGVLKVGELEALGIKLPVLSEHAGQIDETVFVRSPHSLHLVSAFFEKYYSNYDWERGDDRFGFILSTPGKPPGGVRIVVARGWAGRVKIIVSKLVPKGQKPKPPGPGDEEE